MNLILCCLLLFCLSGCASGSKNLSYDSNTFFMYESKPPSHSNKKAHVDFFDKVCSGDDGHGNYQCKYTDDP